MIRIPTLEEYAAYDGAHCFQLWNGLSEDWRCPGCGRSKFEIMRWTKRFPNTPKQFMGWMAGLHTHHDHGGEPLWGQGLGKFAASGARFEPTVICDQCNAADGLVKRRYKSAMGEEFSFTPAEIREFVTATPHSPHKIDVAKALRIWVELKAL